jgi:hypothetical protein
MKTRIDSVNPKYLNDRMEEITSRRVVLRSAVAIGCGMLLPAILIGCDSKKAESTTAAAPDTGADASAKTATPAEPGKVTQASVQYQAQPKAGQKCLDCQHFVGESNTCKVVEGQISPEGWCLLWVQKA